MACYGSIENGESSNLLGSHSEYSGNGKQNNSYQLPPRNNFYRYPLETLLSVIDEDPNEGKINLNYYHSKSHNIWKTVLDTVPFFFCFLFI